MEQLGADIMIGPLSGDESVAVANYAKAHPDEDVRQRHRRRRRTRRCRSCAAELLPLQRRRRAVERRHRRPRATTSSAGGRPRSSWTTTASAGRRPPASSPTSAPSAATIVKRVFPPLNTTDYSSYVRQLRRRTRSTATSGSVGGTGTVASLKAFEQAYGPARRQEIIGNLFLGSRGNFEQVAPADQRRLRRRLRHAGHRLHGRGATEYVAQQKTSGSRSRRSGPMNAANAYNGFYFNYYKAAWALVKGLKAVKRQHLAEPEAAAGGAGQGRRCNTPFGTVKLDKNRQAIEGEWSYQIFAQPGKPRSRRSQFIPNVDQSFGGTFKPRQPPPGRTQPPCKKRSLPWVGKEKPSSTASSSRVTEAATEAVPHADSAGPTLRLRGVGRRFGGLHAVRDVDLDVAHGERRAILGPERRREDDAVQRHRRRLPGRRPARSSCSART